MPIRLPLAITTVLALLLNNAIPAQMASHSNGRMSSSVPSAKLTVTGLSGKTVVLTPEAFKALPHRTVSVMNIHTGKQETYSGVPVTDLLALVAPDKGQDPKGSPNLQVVVAGATDHFAVAIALCDVNPDCRSGASVVADTLDGAPIEKDGAFKLILGEDKRPGRWARNLESLTLTTVKP